ncbi:MAG: type VI secretion system-associated protein TagF [Novosphingobium sp.]|nr:type VI secretion system-associated protein TagF [Novosphingobium sp.]
MSCRPLTRWLFGKLPAQGDFVSRGLDHEMRDALDHWLSAEMEAAHERFGDSFDDRYFSAPAWCFVDRDVAGAWTGGALCASVDAAGRKFPLLMATPANDCAEALGCAAQSLEALYEGIDGRWIADRLIAAEPQPGALPWQPADPAWALLGEDGAACVLPGRFPAGVVAAMLELAA